MKPRTTEGIYKDILDNIYDGVYFVDPERRITYWNKGAERITGFKAGQVVGHRCMDNILNHVTENGVQLCLNGCPLHATIMDGKPREAEVYLHHADGHRLPIRIRTSPLIDKEGKIIGAVESFSDNTSLMDIRQKAKQLEHQALIDPGTGVGNRRQIEIKLQSALAEFLQHQIPVGVLFIDIDRFKLVNDNFGHDIGDRTLQMVAKTLDENIRRGDIVSRWGGDEFIALLVDVTARDLERVAEKLRTLVENSHITIDDRRVAVTVSIGLTMARREDDIDAIIHRADQNMYRGKTAGRNRIAKD